MLNKLCVLIVFPLSVFAMDGETPAQIRAQQDEAYKKSLLTDLKKDWYKIQTQFQAEIEGLQALLGEISVLRSERDNDIKRNEQFSNSRLQQNIEKIAIKIDKLRYELELFIQSHQSSFTELVTQIKNTAKTMEDEQIHDDEFVAIWRPILDCVTQYGIKPAIKKSASSSVSSTPVTAQAQALSALAPQEIYELFQRQIKQIVELGFFSDVLPMSNDEQFKTNGVWDSNKATQHFANAQANFSAVISKGKCAYKEQKFLHAFMLFSLVDSSFLNLPPAKKWNKSARAGRAVAQSYLGLMHKNGQGVRANNQAACKLFESVAVLMDDYCKQAGELMVPFLPICGEAIYELSRMYQYGESVKVSLCQVLCYLGSAAQQGHKIAAHKLKIAVDENARGQYKEPGYVRFIKFMEAEEKNLDPQDAYNISKIVEKNSDARKAYKWLAMAACGGCLDAKYKLGDLLLNLGSDPQWCTLFADLTCQLDGSYIFGSDEDPNLPGDMESLRVIAFCLLSDAAAQGHEKSQKKIVEEFSNQMPFVTLSKPIAWHLKNVRERIPLVTQHKFPQLSGPDPVLELFLCCVDLPTEVINLILEKVSLSLPEPPTKS